MEHLEHPPRPSDRTIHELDFVDQTDPQAMALPDRLPHKISLDHVPMEVLRSSTVDALINQNEDLMSRLAVSLKRNAQLEDRIASLERLNQAVKTKYEVLRDRLMVTEEKDRILLERNRQVDEKMNAFRQKISLLEMQYSELYSDAKDKQQHLLQQIHTYSRRVARLRRYRTQISKIARENRDQNRQLSLELNRFERANEQLKLTITELTQRIQNMNREREASQSSLVNGYEDQLSQLRREIADLTKMSPLLEEKTKEALLLREANIELENRLVAETRRIQELNSRFEEDRLRVQSENQQLRLDNKGLIVAKEELSRDKASLDAQLSAANQKEAGLIDQVESLQCLWRDSQSQISRLSDKNESLQKLNQQLSTTLNQYRREIQVLKEKLEFREQESREKIKEMAGQIRYLSSQEPNQEEGGS